MFVKSKKQVEENLIINNKVAPMVARTSLKTSVKFSVILCLLGIALVCYVFFVLLLYFHSVSSYGNTLLRNTLKTDRLLKNILGQSKVLVPGHMAMAI